MLFTQRRFADPDDAPWPLLTIAADKDGEVTADEVTLEISLDAFEENLQDDGPSDLPQIRNWEFRSTQPIQLTPVYPGSTFSYGFFDRRNNIDAS